MTPPTQAGRVARLFYCSPAAPPSAPPRLRVSPSPRTRAPRSHFATTPYRGAPTIESPSPTPLITAIIPAALSDDFVPSSRGASAATR